MKAAFAWGDARMGSLTGSDPMADVSTQCHRRRGAPDDGRLLETTMEDLVSARAAAEPHVSTPLPSGERLDICWAIDVLRGHEPMRRANG